MDRREFIKVAGKSAAGAVLAASGLGLVPTASAGTAPAHDDDDKYDFLMPRVKFACDKRVLARWNVYPGADKNLLYEFSSVVRCKVKPLAGCNDLAPEHGTDEQFNAVVDFTDMKLVVLKTETI